MAHNRVIRVTLAGLTTLLLAVAGCAAEQPSDTTAQDDDPATAATTEEPAAVVTTEEPAATTPPPSPTAEEPAAVVTTEEPAATTPPASPTAEDAPSDMEGEDMEGMEADDHEHEEQSYPYGEPADASEAGRTITIEATDDMTFDPPTVEVSAGEVVTFEVTNVGLLPHDFTLGDEEAQEEHAAEMAEMDEEMAHTEPNSMTIDAGQTASLTWRFTEGGEILYGCHQPGHYESGMVGSVEIS